jgi:hypothetical protein
MLDSNDSPANDPHYKSLRKMELRSMPPVVRFRKAAVRDRRKGVNLSHWLVAKLTRNMVCFPDIRPFLYDKGHAS